MRFYAWFSIAKFVSIIYIGKYILLIFLLLHNDVCSLDFTQEIDPNLPGDERLARLYAAALEVKHYSGFQILLLRVPNSC